MSLGPLYVLLGEVSVQVLCPFFDWVVCLPGVESCEFFIYFGDQTVVQGIICKGIFPYSWFPSHLLMFSLAMQKLFILMKSHLFILSFMSLGPGDISVKILLHGMSEIFSCLCSPEGLLWCHNLHLSLLSTLNLFSVWCKLVFEFHFFVAVQLSQHHLMKMLFGFHFMFLPTLSNIN